jgi:thiol:disulfide interchange protein DsbG
VLTAAQVAAVPALARIASAGATLMELGSEHGMRTIFAKKGNAFQVFYLVPDGSAAIGGIMWDASGHDLTRDQVAPIPGVIPTVKINGGTGQPQPTKASAQRDDADPLALVHEAVDFR